MKMNFNTMIVSQLIAIVAGIIIWSNNDWTTYNSHLFFKGTLVGLFSALGKTCNTKAAVIGYAGVAGTIASLNGPITVVAVCILDNKMLTPLESISLVLCVFGSAILVLHK